MIDDFMESESGEADEAFDEADEAFDEADEAAEDLGEASRRRRRRGWGRYPSRTRPYGYGRPAGAVRGVGGLQVQGQNGVTRVPFPARLATAAETRRGLATQEVARRELEERLARLESRSRTQPKRDASTTGLVTLALSGGLAAWGAAEAAKTKLTLGNWTKQTQTDAALVVSLTQIAMTGAKLATAQRYARTGFGTTADIYSVGFVLLYAFGKLHQPGTLRHAATHELMLKDLVNANPGDDYILDNGDEYVVLLTATNTKVARKL
jgi:hypothetical protein